jgi:tetratricopeptide (TPR) repeat protein
MITKRVAALPLCLIMLGGCATGGDSLAARFVKQGEPSVDLGGPTLGQPGKSDSAPATPATAPEPPVVSGGSGTTVESADPRLSAALLLEKAVPSAPSHIVVAREYVRLGILDAAFNHATLALAVAPRFSPAHELIARIWRDWGVPADGLGAAYRAVSYDRRSASAQNTLGTLLDAAGRPDLAVAAYDRALTLDPTAAWTLNNACYSEFRSGRLADARRRCESALAIDPTLKAAHNNLALVLAASGDMTQATDEFMAGGDQAAAEYNLGIVCLAGRHWAAAADWFERALKARPGFAEARSRAHTARVRALVGGE